MKSSVKKRLRILKLRLIDWAGFQLTSDERSEFQDKKCQAGFLQETKNIRKNLE